MISSISFPNDALQMGGQKPTADGFTLPSASNFPHEPPGTKNWDSFQQEVQRQAPSGINAGFDSGSISISQRAPRDSVALEADICQIFGGELQNAISNGERWIKDTLLDISGSKINIRISYNGRNGVFITPPDEPERVMRIDLAPDGTPINIANISDPGLFLSEAATHLGLDMQVQGFFTNTAAFENWAGELHSTRIQNERISEIVSDVERLTRPETSYIGETGKYVNQNMFQLSDLDQPLSTHGLDTCSALIVIDAVNGLHYLAHLDATSSPQRIINSLSDLDIRNAEIFLAPGSGDTVLSMRNGINALDELGATENLQILQLDGVFPGVISHNGDVFAIPAGDNLGDWDRDGNTRF